MKTLVSIVDNTYFKITKFKKMDNPILRDKFRGCLLGALIGDCFGAPFEGDTMKPGDKARVQKYFNEMPYNPAITQKYTDDTAMTMSIAKFLTESPDLDYKYLANLFVTEYRNQPDRGYGAHVVNLFDKLHCQYYDDIFEAATEQFNGKGSAGNGGAMRVAPVALFFHDDYDKMLTVARNVTRITHSNVSGIHGALVQCLAVQQALKLDRDEPLTNYTAFCNEMVEKMRVIEKNEGKDNSSKGEYIDILSLVKESLDMSKEHEDNTFHEYIAKTLGNGILAEDSVGTALYCFLRAQKPIPEIQANNVVQRAVQYAITLGGDTDTIASMAGAIAGAHVGEEAISSTLIKCCESYRDVIKLADKLFDVKFKKE